MSHNVQFTYIPFVLGFYLDTNSESGNVRNKDIMCSSQSVTACRVIDTRETIKKQTPFAG